MVHRALADYAGGARACQRLGTSTSLVRHCKQRRSQAVAYTPMTQRHPEACRGSDTGRRPRVVRIHSRPT